MIPVKAGLKFSYTSFMHIKLINAVFASCLKLRCSIVSITNSFEMMTFLSTPGTLNEEPHLSIEQHHLFWKVRDSNGSLT